MSFARTKIQPPRQRAGLITRPALERALGQALAGQRLTLISAPAGFGKTAALTRQLERLPEDTALAWISLDAGDDLPQLLECFVAALEPFDLPWRVDPDSLAKTAGARGGRAAVAHELINTLAAAEVGRGLIVLDDLHRVDDAAVFEFLDRLVERMPAAWGVVIASRIDPPLALARLRATGELAEFRQRELHFDHDEVMQLGASLDAHPAHVLTDTDAELLLARTGGWAAGLRLALASALAERPAAQGIAWASAGHKMDRHLFDYLADEVLDDMPAELRDFLLRCAVLPELSAARCAAVTGDPLAAQRLAEIERRELFVSVLDDGPERTLRLHDLLRDFLDDRLKREHPHELPELLKRAAGGEPDTLRRIGYLVRAQAWDEAVQALVAEGPDLLTRGAIDAVVRLIELLPPALREASAPVQMLRGLTAWARWDWTTMNDAMQRAVAAGRDASQQQLARAYRVAALAGIGQRAQARELLHALRKEPMEGEPLLLTLLAENWAAFDDSRFADLVPLFERQLQQLQAVTSGAMWYQCMPVPPYLALPGMREPLQRYVDGALARVPTTPSTLRALALGLQGGLLVWAGRPEEALEVLAEAESDARWLGRPLNASSMVYGQIAFAHTLRGERDAARAAWNIHLEQNRALGDKPGMLRLSFTAYGAARMALAMGDDDEARRLFEMVDEPPLPGERPALVVTRCALPGYRALLAGDVPGAIAGFERALLEADRIDLFGHASELRLRTALCLAQLGGARDAVCHLAPVFARHRDNEEVGPVLMAGPRVLQGLAAFGWNSLLSADEHALLARWAALAQSLQTAPAQAAAAPATANTLLSPREAEVLERIAAGDSNKLIARAFDLSPHTVKRHVANILDKIGAQSRGQAAAWWRQQH
jgi:LuxR family maltose regulon positive regulatory protein